MARITRPTLMIHNVRREYFELDLASYRLSFDDGLFSQYYYYPLLERVKSEMLFFPITSMITEGPRRPAFDGMHLPYVKSPQYMAAARTPAGRMHFMTTEEVQFLKAQAGVQIGAHSHFHEVTLTRHLPKKPNSRWKRERLGEFPDHLTRALASRSRLAFRGSFFRNGRMIRRTVSQWEEFVRYDTERCLDWFHRHLNFQPTAYCLPFNEYSDRLIEVLKSFGFTTFFGRRAKGTTVIARTDIDRLLEEHPARHG